MATLKDIAKKTGFSLSVVSRAMNPHPDQQVAPHTRDVILSAAAELGYRPNQGASSLARGRSAFIGCFLPPMLGELIGQMVAGLSSISNQYGFACNIYFGSGEADYKDFLKNCRSVQNAGVISYMPSAYMLRESSDESFLAMVRELTQHAGEVVLLNCAQVNIDHVQTLCIDNHHIGQLAAECLLQNDCTSYIIPMVDTSQSWQLRQRVEGFYSTLQQRQAAVQKIKLPFHRNYDINSPILLDAIRSVLQKDSDRLGIFTLTDYEAIALYNLLTAENMQHFIGKKINIVGCDNIISSSMLTPQLTTISQQEVFFNLGKLSMSMLLNKLIKADLPLDMDLLKPQLVKRQSA